MPQLKIKKMKNNLLKGTFLLAIAGMIVFTGCKYDEGVGISFRAKRDRFANEWRITEYMRDTTNLSAQFTDTNNTVYGEPVLVTTRTGRYSVIVSSDTSYKYDTSVWANPLFWEGRMQIAAMSEALGFAYNSSSDTNVFFAPRGAWTFDEKSSSVQMSPELAHIDTIPNIEYKIKELREDALKLEWVDESDVVRKISFEPINDEDFFL